MSQQTHPEQAVAWRTPCMAALRVAYALAFALTNTACRASEYAACSSSSSLSSSISSGLSSIGSSLSGVSAAAVAAAAGGVGGGSSSGGSGSSGSGGQEQPTFGRFFVSDTALVVQLFQVGGGGGYIHA